jgi:dipeptidyl aminopeptidase/acylaminoacyl peptidase
MSVDGSDAHRLTAAVSDDFAPSWSPDGSRIAFIRVPDGTLEAATGPATHRNQVWTMASDGRDEQRITEISSGAFRPAWSPAGDVIAFDAGQRLWLVHPDGSGLVQVAGTTALGGYAAAWSPDGASLLFGGHEPGKVEGQVVFETSPPDGSPRRVVKQPTGASLPAWRPGGDASGRTTSDGTLVIMAGADGVTFAPPPAGSGAGALTAEQALAAFEKVDAEFVEAPDITSQLGVYTSAVGNGIYRFKDRLAWGYSWRACPPPPLIGPGQALPGPMSSPCVEWLFLDAHSGEMLEAVFQH